MVITLFTNFIFFELRFGMPERIEEDEEKSWAVQATANAAIFTSIKKES